MRLGAESAGEGQEQHPIRLIQPGADLGNEIGFVHVDAPVIKGQLRKAVVGAGIQVEAHRKCSMQGGKQAAVQFLLPRVVRL